jgi:hypothetical protein
MTDPSSLGSWSMVKRGGLVLLLIVASACSGNGLPTAPTTMPPAPTPTPRPLPPTIASTFHLTGIAVADDGGPVTGATVIVQPNDYPNVPSVSRVTDGRGSYSIDFDAHHVDVPRAVLGFLIAESPGRDRFVNWIAAPATGAQNVLQDLHLYRIKRIITGQSTLVTVVSGDTSCSEDGLYVCRIVHVEVPTDGLLTIEVLPTPSATNTGLALVDDIGDGSRASGTFRVTAGTEVVVFIGMAWTSTVSQSGMLKTSLAPDVIR